MAKLIYLLLLCFSLQLVAQETATNVDAKENVEDPTGLSLLPDLPAKNQIPLFDNRFRIDYEVEEITMVFFRKRGSASVILVKPDGSKVNVINADDQDIQWYDDKTYDLIKIKKPTPGPWQAIGQILPESKIMVLTDIELNVPPLPDHLMVGETIKVTATLSNGGQPIVAKDFRDLLRLDVLFISSNNAEFENFGAGVIELTTLADDGRNFDEKPRDGIFTGEFKLDMRPGQWQPKFVVKTPLYTREVVQEPVILHKSPISYEVALATKAEDLHWLTFKVTDPMINPKSVALQGKVRFPNNEIQSFTLGESAEVDKKLKIVNYASGTYKVDSILFAQTVTGRDVVISLPQASFVAEVVEPEPVAPAAADSENAGLTTAASEMPASAVVNEPVVEEEKPFPWLLVILSNIIILGGGGFAIWMVATDRSFKTLFAKKNNSMDLDSLVMPGASEAKTSSAAQKNSKKNDIMELSLPDD
ncbi:TIGR03503 family protein [Rheinheimera sp. 1928-s]|uniref:TIGR03503 family protein n=1 Tax=Rheinheimera sp. 1928-s TaxID=3033803 RepID=UPI002631F3D0|nr:TIGR03503 family protein [Rheinheimera sp. 1928-s]MDF3124445.1 TIGR03503 family protein [Rheinheimera sp. 1928-s]